MNNTATNSTPWRLYQRLTYGYPAQMLMVGKEATIN